MPITPIELKTPTFLKHEDETTPKADTRSRQL
jgi:hypothetical protein